MTLIVMSCFSGLPVWRKPIRKQRKLSFRKQSKKTGAKLVIPIHWDNFFSPLDRPIKSMPFFVENTGKVFFKLAKYCEENVVNLIVQHPLTSIEI